MKTSNEGSGIRNQGSAISNQGSVISNQGSGAMRLLSILLVGALAACSTPVETGNDEEIIDELMEPVGKSYNVRMNFKRIEIMGDCDPDNFGITDKGEFSYRVSYSLQNADGSWTQKRLVAETNRFGDAVQGDFEKKGPQGVFTISETVVQNLADGLNYRMHLSAIEWDHPIRDSRMKGKTATEENSAGGSKLTYSHKLDLGSSSSCKVRLHVTATEEAV